MADTRLLVCNCQKSMTLDGARIATAIGQSEPLPVHTELCGSQLSTVLDALGGTTPVRIACTQEAALFTEAADEIEGAVDLSFVNIRERAGWCAPDADPNPKIAALLAMAAYPSKPAGLTTLESDGI
ncbi:MAG: 4Fe-4S ferredoxin, partial [Pseudomonadota bacterium]